MPKLTILPYNDMGEAVKRGASSINSRATRKEIAAKVLASANREGVGNIRTVDVVAADGTHISSWDIRNYGLTAVQVDGEGSTLFENSIFNMEGMKMSEVETSPADAEAKIAADLAAKQEAAAAAKAEKERLKAEKLAAKELEKAAKAEKAAEAKAAKEALKAEKAAEREAKKLERAATKPEKKPRRDFSETKKGQVLQMIKDGNGIVSYMAATLGLNTETAARSLIADLKHMGYEFTTHRDTETKVLRYVYSGGPDTEASSNEIDGEEDAESPETESPVEEQEVA